MIKIASFEERTRGLRHLFQNPKVPSSLPVRPSELEAAGAADRLTLSHDAVREQNGDSGETPVKGARG